MAESQNHKELKARAIKYLWDKSYYTTREEVNCGHYGIYDAWGITYEFETMGIEVKVSRSDFGNNRKKEVKLEWLLENTERYYDSWYQYWVPAERNYILCPAHMVQPFEIHEHYGLLWFNGNRLLNKKKAPVIEMPIKHKLKALIGFLDGPMRNERQEVLSLG